MILYGGGDNAFQMLRRIAFGKPLLYGIAHDVAELLPRAGRDFQKALILNNPQQGSEILRFKFGNGQMTNRREDMVFHTGENAGGIISRPFLLVLCQASATALKHFSGEQAAFSAMRCCAGLIFCASNLRIPSRCCRASARETSG